MATERFDAFKAIPKGDRLHVVLVETETDRPWVETRTWHYQSHFQFLVRDTEDRRLLRHPVSTNRSEASITAIIPPFGISKKAERALARLTPGYTTVESLDIVNALWEFPNEAIPPLSPSELAELKAIEGLEQVAVIYGDREKHVLLYHWNADTQTLMKVLPDRPDRIRL